MRQINVGNYPGVPVRCPMERYDAAPASRTQATHLLTAGCVDYDRRELAVTVLLHCRDRPYAVSLRAMVPSWASGRPAERQTKRVWEFLGGATLTFTFFAMIADSPFRQLAWGNFAYGGLLAVLPSVLSLRCSRHLCRTAAGTWGLYLFPSGTSSWFGPSAAG
jgi:hypothetical protein